MSAYRFHGTERATVEIDGWFRPGGVAIPRRLALDLDAEGLARVSLFGFHVEGLRITGVPWLRSSYAELLWRIAVRTGETSAWWVIACDLEQLGPSLMAKRFVRYPVRSQRVAVTTEQVRSEGGAGGLAIALAAPGAEPVAPEQRLLLVGPSAEWDVPWGDAEPVAHRATATVTTDSLAVATLGAPVRWATSALVRTGREHRCGVARARR